MTRKAIQFRLRSLFIVTAIVAMGCLVGPPIVHEVRDWLASWQEIGEPGTIKPYVNNTNTNYLFDASDEGADLETEEEMAPAPVQASPPKN